MAVNPVLADSSDFIQWVREERDPLTNLGIAACAKRIDAIVLSLDDHFSKIPGIRVVTQQELWLRPSISRIFLSKLTQYRDLD